MFHVKHEADTIKNSMKPEKVNDNLKKVIKQAQDLNIPVPVNIYEKVFINPRPRKRFGCCKKINGTYHIEISEFILECSDEKIREVLAHEILHTCRGCYDHGNKWKIYAGKMNEAYGYNIKRTSSFEDMGIRCEPQTKKENIKYIIKCRSCGREYPRQRYTAMMKKISSYRCRCGGALDVFKLEK